MGFFSGASDPKLSLKRTGVYLSDGVAHKGPDGTWLGIGVQHTYKVKIGTVKTVEGRGNKGAVVEFEILESTYDKNPVGSTASWFCGMSKQPEAGLRDFMLFIAACFGVDPADEVKVREAAKEEMLEYACDPSNPMGDYGLIMHVTTKTKLTKNGSPFTIHIWSPAENPPASP